MKPLSECRSLLVDDAKFNPVILVESLKAGHKLRLPRLLAVRIVSGVPPRLPKEVRS